MRPARAPTFAIVVDANILLGLVLGVRGWATWDSIRTRRRLLMSTEAVAEVMAVATDRQSRAPNAPSRAAASIDLIEIPPASCYAEAMPAAGLMLRNAVASCNGSIDDAHVLALAWTHDADIWSHDRDFAGTGWPSWSSANLAAALAEESASPAQPS